MAIQQMCVKSKTGYNWYACDSSSFHENNSDPFDNKVLRLEELYPRLEFAILTYDPNRKIAPKKYRPWVEE